MTVDTFATAGRWLAGMVLVPVQGMTDGEMYFVNTEKYYEWRQGYITSEVFAKYCCKLTGVKVEPSELEKKMRRSDESGGAK